MIPLISLSSRGATLLNRFWDEYPSWEDAEKAWDTAEDLPSVGQPSVPGITNRRFLRLKALCWVVKKDNRFLILRRLFRRPWKYASGYIRSLLRRPSYQRCDDFYCFGVNGVVDVLKLMEEKNSIFVLGFSYCQKPKECPSVRFSDQCNADPKNPICRQCFIGKCLHTLPKTRTIPKIIPTINAIGQHMMEVIDRHKGQQVFFLITACEMAIEMFGDFSNMVGSKGIGVKLQGRFCNTWRAFQLSEEGIKPGMTIITPSTQRKMLALLRYWRECHDGHANKNCYHEIVSKLEEE